MCTAYLLYEANLICYIPPVVDCCFVLCVIFVLSSYIPMRWQTKQNTSVLVQKSNIQYRTHLSPAVDCCIIYIYLNLRQNQNLGIASADESKYYYLPLTDNTLSSSLICIYIDNVERNRSVLVSKKQTINLYTNLPPHLII